MTAPRKTMTSEEAIAWLENWDTKAFARDICAAISAETRDDQRRRERAAFGPLGRLDN